MIPKSQLASWRAVCEAATPGPWGRTSSTDPHWLREVRDSDGEGVAWCGMFPIDQAHDNAAFIATARAAVPALLDEVDRLSAEVTALRESLMRACELRSVCHEHERELWAMRQAANHIAEPFSHDRVQDEYNKFPGRIEELERLRKLVGEACGIGDLLANAADRESDMSDEEVSGYRARGAERLAAIRKEAGCE